MFHVKQRLIVVGIVTVVAGAAAGRAHTTLEASPAEGQAESLAASAQHAPPVIMRGSRILGRDVDNALGDRLGSVSDLAVRLDDGTIPYAVLETGGVLGVGSTYVAMSWDRFEVGSDERFIVDASPEMLDLMEEFDTNAEWPVTIEAEHAASSVVSESTDDGIRVGEVIKGSVLLGMSVHNLEGDDLGHIEDLAVHREDGQVRYIVLAHGGVFGIGDSYVAVPLERLQINPTEGVMMLDVSADELAESPAFEGNWPESVAPTF